MAAATRQLRRRTLIAGDAQATVIGATRRARGFHLFAALLLLNALLTFHNVWPTLLVRWPGELSVELAGVLLLLYAWRRLRGTLPRGLLPALAGLFVLGALGRYAEVTAPALYGREVNLYWDLRHVASLSGMLAHVASSWLLATVTAGLLILLTLIYAAALWSLRRIDNALQSPRMGPGIFFAALAASAWFTLQRLDEQLPRVPQFSIPVSKTYARQLARIHATLNEQATGRRLPASPAWFSTPSFKTGSDVMVVFLESYGRVVYDRGELFRSLAAARANLNDAVTVTGRGMVSAFVESPTFGGGSWLAHLSFLAGIEVRDAALGELLMTQPRRTLGTELAEHGYRRVALMPGLKKSWPEGAFYGFDRIYDDAALGYRGPAFGWWRIPDQFSLAKLDSLELTGRTDVHPRAPLFTFFPTVSTHTPFQPTPPYQTDWSRMLSPSPYDAAALQQSLSRDPEWSKLGAGYGTAVAYSLETLAGYLRAHGNDDLIMVILGDHQPPAMVSGEHASWDVPVHVIASKQGLLGALETCGFVPGVIPAAATAGAMHRLAPSLLFALNAAASPGSQARSSEQCPLRDRRGR